MYSTLLLNKAAKEWLGTSHQNGCSMRGVACDCTGLMTGIYKDLGIIDIPVTYNYGAFWYLKKGCNELVLPYLEEYFQRVDSLEPGDLISYRFGRAQYAHVAMYLGEGRIIHCNADFGTEIIHKIEIENRESGYWRLKCLLSQAEAIT